MNGYDQRISVAVNDRSANSDKATTILIVGCLQLKNKHKIR